MQLSEFYFKAVVYMQARSLKGDCKMTPNVLTHAYKIMRVWLKEDPFVSDLTERMDRSKLLLALNENGSPTLESVAGELDTLADSWAAGIVLRQRLEGVPEHQLYPNDARPNQPCHGLSLIHI